MKNIENKKKFVIPPFKKLEFGMNFKQNRKLTNRVDKPDNVTTQPDSYFSENYPPNPLQSGTYLLMSPFEGRVGSFFVKH